MSGVRTRWQQQCFACTVALVEVSGCEPAMTVNVEGIVDFVGYFRNVAADVDVGVVVKPAGFDGAP